jgi:hypothetical protein
MAQGWWRALALLGCAVLGAQTAAHAETWTKVTLTAAQVSAAHSGTLKLFPKPETAYFHATTKAASNGKGTIFVCGWVDAQSKAGGFPGYKPYLGYFKGNAFIALGVAGENDLGWEGSHRECDTRGIGLGLKDPASPHKRP